MCLLASPVFADSVWDKRRDDGPRVDRFFFDNDEINTQARVVMLGGGLSGYYQRKAYGFPSVDLEISVWRYLTLGILGSFYLTSDTGYSFSGYQGLATINIYPLGKFDMIWLRLAGGLLSTTLSATTKATVTYTTFQALLGWRFLIFDPVSMFNIGIALGAQTYSASGRSVTLPTGIFEVGLFL